MLLLGEHDVSLDDKGRFRLPSVLLRQLGKEEKGDNVNLVLHFGMEKCIWMWHEDVFKKLLTELSKLNFFNSRQRQFNRFFNRGMTQLVTDKADRVLMRERLLDYAGLEKNGSAMLLAQQQRIEIWNPKVYDSMFTGADADDFSDLSDKVMGGGGESGAESDEIDLGAFFSGLTGNDKTMKE